jgi:integrase
MLRFTYQKKQLRLSSGINVDPKYWNAEKELPHPNYYNYIIVRDHLSGISDIITSHSTKGVSIDRLKAEIKAFTNIDNKNVPSFLQVAKSLIEYKKKMGIDPKYFRTLYNRIVEYEEDNNLTLQLSDIDEIFRDSFIIWCRGREYATNTVQRFLKRIREVKLFAIKNKVILDDGFTNTNWKIKKFNTDAFVLSPNEIKKLNQHIPKAQHLKDTKARFLCTYYTGVRISDFKLLQFFRIIEDEGDSFIEFRTIKTDVLVVLPLFDELKVILAEYKGFPKAISDQKQNEYLKELFKAILDYDIRIRKSISYKLRIETVKAYTQVTNHTARRTFATHLYVKGVPLSTIQLILGHSDPTQTVEYIKLESMQKRMSSKELLKILKNSMTR